MSQPNLFYNIVTFNWPEEPVRLYFSQNKEGSYARLYKTAWPKEIEFIFPGIHASGEDYIYTTYDAEVKGFKHLDLDFKNDNPELAKRFYTRRLQYYFKKKEGQITHKGFIGELEVWFRSKRRTNELYDFYEKYALRILIRTVSDFPEILLSYEGASRVLKASYEEITKDISNQNINYLLWGKGIIKLRRYLDKESREDHVVRPILNLDLAQDLQIPVEAPVRENRYKRYLEEISLFANQYFAKSDFKDLFPGLANDFLPVAPANISSVESSLNQLAFENDAVSIDAKTGFRRLHPYQKCPYSTVHVIFVYHSSHKAERDKMAGYLKDGVSFYRGLKNYAGIEAFISEKEDIIFNDSINPIPEVEKALETGRYNNKGIKYLAVYLTPYTKLESSRQQVRFYARVKELLLKRDIPSQSIEAERLVNPDNNFVYILTTLSIAILAKLGGIPWRLNNPVKQELIIGIGAFVHPSSSDKTKYLSSAFSFDNTGQFKSFDYFIRNEVHLLAGAIANKVRQFTTINEKLERLIIHFYKPASSRELQAIEDELKRLNLPNVPKIFIVTVNKTESQDIIAFDKDWNDRMPESGVFVSIGNKKYLLFNNARVGNAHPFSEGFPFPVKLAIDCNDEKQLSDMDTIKELIGQVYQFSRMYWKSLSQQNLPVTIKYPEMLAEVAPYFGDPDIPDASKNSLWFL